jgi:hypothetical protein
MGFLDSLGKTLKSFGKAAAAGPGVVYDLATTTIPGNQWGSADDGGFSDLLDSLGHRASRGVSPMTDSSTLTGAAFGGTMHGLNKAYHEAVDQPISTSFIMLSHLDPGNGAGTDSHYGDLFSGDAWAQAYSIAEHQSIGQSTVDALSSATDPLARADKDGTAFQNNDWVQKHPTLANISAIGVDIGVSWNTDPGVVAGRAAGQAHQVYGLGKLTQADKLGLPARLAGEEKGALGRNLSTRLDDYISYINGENKLGRPLLAEEIHAISPELGHTASGKAIAGALGEALKLPDVAQRENAARRVIAVAAGDTSQIDRLNAEIADTAAISDALRNITAGATTKLDQQALAKSVILNPAFNADMARQVTNLDEGANVSKFIEGWTKETDAKLKAQENLLNLQSNLNYIPGTHVRTSGRLRAVQGDAVLDKVAGAHEATLDAARRMANRESYSSVYQKSLYHVPLMVVQPVGWAVSPITKGYRAGLRALQQTNYIGVANLHDWEGATDQLNSMMRIAHVDNDVRIAELSRAYSSYSEADKMRAIERVEHLAVQGLARRLSEKHGLDIDADFIGKSMIDGQAGRSNSLARMEGGRIYAATAQPEDMAMRTRTAMLADSLAQKGDQAANAADRLALKRGKVEELSNFKPRVDQVLDEHGVPISLPLVTSQLGNQVPLFDIERATKLATDKAWVERLHHHSQLWRENRRDLAGLQGALTHAYAGPNKSLVARLEKAVLLKRTTLDAVMDAASTMNRWWKMSVLFRLGYPMRVLSDDHMRIAGRLHYGPFLKANVPEAAANFKYNLIARRREAGTGFRDLQQQRSRLLGDQALLTDVLGRDAISDGEWTRFTEARKTFYSGKATREERAAAQRVMRQVDPRGHADEFYDLQHQVSTHAASVSGTRGAITRWTNQMAEDGADVATLSRRIAEAETKVAEKEAARAHALEQLSGKPDPNELRKQLAQVNRLIDKGPTLGEKRHIGSARIQLDSEHTVEGVYPSATSGYRLAAQSDTSYQMLISDGEENAMNLITSGQHRTIRGYKSPTDEGEAGHTQVWANVLNHQFQHSPELMAFVKGEVETPEQFAKWLRKPENKYIVARMEQYAHDPVGWGSRLQELVHDYIPTPELRDAVASGRVTPRQLEKMFPKGGSTPRPDVHGQLADVNTGRAAATRVFSNGVGRMFRYLSEVPTDQLSRHPFMNAVYKSEVKQAFEVRKAYRAKTGTEFTQEDIHEIERMARTKALGELKRTLWDVSAHSHAAHVMRFVSPFFAAHQEALTRWWRISQDDPSIVRHFQLAFDAPRKMGLTYNPDTGEVNPGDSIGQGNRIMLQVPFGNDTAVNKWLRKLGGGTNWSISEQGLNIILQNGLANPGVGPVVSIPTETLVQKYPTAANFEKAARALNQYPPQQHGLLGIAGEQITPAWGRNALALMGVNDARYSQIYMQNMSDNIIGWRQAHEGQDITDDVMDGLAEMTAHETHRDLLVMMGSNLLSITPARPESKYAVVQHGLTKLKEQMRAGGHDQDWLREQFSKQYGDIYLAMIYSMGDNPARLNENGAEVGAMQQHRTLLNKVDPSLTQMVIGPEAAMDAKADPALGRYSAAARSFLEATKTKPGGSQAYVGSKSVDEASLKILINEGWNQYDELTNYLDVAAQQQGLQGYEDSPQLVKAKTAGVAYIKSHNYAFRNDYDSFSAGGYDAKLDDMRQIAGNKKLASNPLRSDVYWLGQYLTLRDSISTAMQQRAAAGGSKTITAKANSDLAQAFAAGVHYINSQNTYFKQFSYHGVIEHDPYLQPPSAQELVAADAGGN